MLTAVSSFYTTNRTRILLFAVCFALITNIATIMVLFDQLEHESLCDEQNDFNNFIEGSHHQQLQSISEKSNEIIIPKPQKQLYPPQQSPKQLKTQKVENTSHTGKFGILSARGGKYKIFEFEPSEIKSTDWKYYLDYNIPQIHYNSHECNHLNFISSIFMNALEKLLHMRSYGWFIQYNCASYLQTEYRP
eukprot:882610_1